MIAAAKSVRSVNVESAHAALLARRNAANAKCSLSPIVCDSLVVGKTKQFSCQIRRFVISITYPATKPKLKDLLTIFSTPFIWY